MKIPCPIRQLSTRWSLVVVVALYSTTQAHHRKMRPLVGVNVLSHVLFFPFTSPSHAFALPFQCEKLSLWTFTRMANWYHERCHEESFSCPICRQTFLHGTMTGMQVAAHVPGFTLQRASFTSTSQSLRLSFGTSLCTPDDRATEMFPERHSGME